MDIADAVDEMHDRLDEVSHRRRSSGRPHTKCRYCGTPHLSWAHKLDKGWRLVDTSGQLHVCEVYLSRQSTTGGR